MVERDDKLHPKYPVKQPWLDGYKIGNALLPQMMLGVEVFVLDSVLNDLPSSWIEFYESSVSAQQIEDLSEFVKNAHRHYGVKKIPKMHKTPDEKTLSANELKGTWAQARSQVTIKLINIEGHKHSFFGFEKPGLRDLREVDKLIADPERLKTAQEVVRAAKYQLVRNPEVVDLVNETRNFIATNYEPRPNSWARNPFYDKLFMMQDRMRSMIMTNLGSDYSSDQLFWLKW